MFSTLLGDYLVTERKLSLQKNAALNKDSTIQKKKTNQNKTNHPKESQDLYYICLPCINPDLDYETRNSQKYKRSYTGDIQINQHKCVQCDVHLLHTFSVFFKALVYAVIVNVRFVLQKLCLQTVQVCATRVTEYSPPQL